MYCSQIFIGTDTQLDQTESDVFSVEWVDGAAEDCAALHRLLGTDYVYYLAPHTGCGCGWDVMNVGTSNDKLSQQSCNFLKLYLTRLKAEGIAVKLLSTCEGMVGNSECQELHVTMDDFFEELNAYRVPFGSTESRVYTFEG